MNSAKGLHLNFYLDGTYELKTPTNRLVTVHQKTDYPVSGQIDIELNLRKKEKMEIALRIPAWSEKSLVTVNGDPIENIVPGKYLILDRIWENGDKISIEFDMKGKIHTMHTNPSYIAITRGPIVMARDERLQGPALEAILTPVKNENKQIDLTLKEHSDKSIWMLFTAKFIPESYAEQGAEPVETELCDYASAGNTLGDNPFFKVWMPQLFDPRD